MIDHSRKRQRTQIKDNRPAGTTSSMKRMRIWNFLKLPNHRFFITFVLLNRIFIVFYSSKPWKYGHKLPSAHFWDRKLCKVLLVVVRWHVRRFHMDLDLYDKVTYSIFSLPCCPSWILSVPGGRVFIFLSDKPHVFLEYMFCLPEILASIIKLSVQIDGRKGWTSAPEHLETRPPILFTVPLWVELQHDWGIMLDGKSNQLIWDGVDVGGCSSVWQVSRNEFQAYDCAFLLSAFQRKANWWVRKVGPLGLRSCASLWIKLIGWTGTKVKQGIHRQRNWCLCKWNN